MFDPKKLFERLPRLERDRPFRYLGRRVVQAMSEAATANLVLGRRSAPGGYLVLRVAAEPGERDEWLSQFSESRAAILAEVAREAAARDIRPRSSLDIQLLVLDREEAVGGAARRALETACPPAAVEPLYARLLDERELIVPLRMRSVLLETDPPGAQAYVDHNPVGVTPCRIEAAAGGEHVVTFSRPGCLLHEQQLRVDAGASGELSCRVRLQAEPAMGALEVITYPPRARVRIGEEERESPASWRLPAGPAEIRIEMEEFEPETIRIELPASPPQRPHRIRVRLSYAGPQRDEVVGRLLVYRAVPTPPPDADPDTNRIRSFFQDAEPEPDVPLAVPAGVEPLGECPVRRGVLIIGRDGGEGEIIPDVRLFDPENSVSRGCHAWLWVYADRSTGADYNTFLVGCGAATGIRVDGTLVTESRRLADDAVIEVGNFRLRVLKEVPRPRVEFRG